MPSTTDQRPADLPEYQVVPGFQDALPANAMRGRVIAVTGATGGLGTALSKSLAEQGATIILLGRKMKKLEALYDVVDALGTAITRPCMALAGRAS